MMKQKKKKNRSSSISSSDADSDRDPNVLAKINRHIDQYMSEQKKNEEYRMLLLGPGESGKSTILMNLMKNTNDQKQM